MMLRSKKTRIPWYTVNFDSATGLANALINTLHGKEFSGVGSVPQSEWLARLINFLPWKLKKAVYVKGSAKGAVDPQRLNRVVAEDFTQWITARYPARKYPAILVGSSNGPAIHLGAAMGVPWLPQTFLIPVKTPQHLSVDDPISRMEWARGPAAALLRANPELQLHHMMDPNQDRPMLETTSYFRIKRLSLGVAYEKFITDNLEEGGTLILVDCEKKWPVTYVDERYYFQFGGMGGTTIEEYHHGSDRVREFLRKEGAATDKWQAPPTDGWLPEAEWGFEKKIEEDLFRLAQKKHYRIARMAFREPEDPSPFVADLYRWWYREKGIESRQLLIETFFLTEPYRVLRTGTVPFWMAFNAKKSAEEVKAYLVRSEPFDHIYLLPFSHGMKGQGLASVQDYRDLFSFARKGGDFIGSEPHLYPFDFGIYARYEKELKRKLTSACPLQPPLRLDQLRCFIAGTKNSHAVRWTEEK